jgi:hypothetical protein
MNQESYEKIYKIVYQVINDFNDEIEVKVDLTNGRNTRLFGGEAPLNSLELVTLIVYVEEELEVALGHSVTLANDRAMSRRVSPFSTVGLLVDYIFELISE